MFEDHLVKPCTVQAKNGIRAIDTMKDTAALASRLDKPGTLAEAMSLFYSAGKRSLDLQQKWQSEWSDWAAYASELPGADTTSKLVSRQNNIVLQASAQLSAQTTEALELIENIFVGYSFWVSQQLDKSDDPTPRTNPSSSA